MASIDIPSVLIEALVILLPGIVVTAAALRPDEVSIPGRIALAYGAGFVAVSFSAWLLACFGILNTASFLVLLTLLTGGAGFVAWRRAPLKEHVDAVKRQFWPERFSFILGIVVLVAIAWGFSNSSPLFSLGNTALRFWGDGVEIADGGEVPDQTLQWGEAREPATSKMLLNTHSAAMSLVTEDPLPAVGASAWLVSVFLCAALWWFAWEIGLRWLAPLFPLLGAANVAFLYNEMSTDLFPYRAESFGRALAFCGLTLAVVSLRNEQRWPSYILAGLLFGFAAGTHLVPTIIGFGMLGGFVVYLLLRRELTLQRFLRTLAAYATAGLMLVLAWATPQANLGFEGTVKSNAGARRDVDGTVLFEKGSFRSLTEVEARDWYIEPTQLMTDFVRSSTRLETGSPWLWIGLAIAVLVALAFLGPPRIRDGAALIASLVIVTITTTLIFDRIYTSYALAMFGRRRLYDYAILPTWFLILVAGTAILYGLRKWKPPLAPAVAGIVTLVLLVVIIPDLRKVKPQRDTRFEVQEMNWIRNNAECDARFLTNYRSGATFQVLAGRVAVSEGMGPYFRPDLLDEVNEFLLDANEFFRDPFRNKDFLAEHGIDYIVMRKVGGGDGSLRSSLGDVELMAQADFLELVFPGKRANIYRVTGMESDREFPDPARFPGYGCFEGEIAL
jgi:hypothetical protein